MKTIEVSDAFAEAHALGAALGRSHNLMEQIIVEIVMDVRTLSDLVQFLGTSAPPINFLAWEAIRDWKIQWDGHDSRGVGVRGTRLETILGTCGKLPVSGEFLVVIRQMLEVFRREAEQIKKAKVE